MKHNLNFKSVSVFKNVDTESSSVFSNPKSLIKIRSKLNAFLLQEEEPGNSNKQIKAKPKSSYKTLGV